VSAAVADAVREPAAGVAAPVLARIHDSARRLVDQLPGHQRFIDHCCKLI